MPYLTPDEIPDGFVCRALIIPDDPQWIEIVNGALLELTHPYRFEKFGDVTPEQTSEIFTEMVMKYIKKAACLLGSIIPYATAIVPYGTLACDGSTYNRVDYPKLYAVLDSAFIIDADTFNVPDLRGRAIIGNGKGTGLTERAIGDTGGEEIHELTVAELPSHTHENDPHTHSDAGHIHGYSYPTINLDFEAPGVPDVFGAGNPPIPLSTTVSYANISSDSISIDNTGDGDSHENMSPFTALRYCIIAR